MTCLALHHPIHSSRIRMPSVMRKVSLCAALAANPTVMTQHISYLMSRTSRIKALMKS